MARIFPLDIPRRSAHSRGIVQAKPSGGDKGKIGAYVHVRSDSKRPQQPKKHKNVHEEEAGHDRAEPRAEADEAMGEETGKGSFGATHTPPEKKQEDGDDEEVKQPDKECEWKAYLAPIGYEYYHNTKTGSWASNCQAVRFFVSCL